MRSRVMSPTDSTVGRRLTANVRPGRMVFSDPNWMPTAHSSPDAPDYQSYHRLNTSCPSSTRCRVKAFSRHGFEMSTGAELSPDLGRPHFGVNNLTCGLGTDRTESPARRLRLIPGNVAIHGFSREFVMRNDDSRHARLHQINKRTPPGLGKNADEELFDGTDEHLFASSLLLFRVGSGLYAEPSYWCRFGHHLGSGTPIRQRGKWTTPLESV